MFGRKNEELLFVLDTNVYMHSLESVVRYVSENENVKYLIPIKVIQELEHLTKINNIEAVLALEKIEKFKEQGKANVIEEIIKPSSVVSYWDDDLVDFYILAVALKYRAILISGDKIMCYIALSKSIEIIYEDFSVYCESDKDLAYENFKNKITEFFAGENRFDLKECSCIPKCLIDTSVVIHNMPVIQKYLSQKEENVLGISIQTLIELNKIATFKEKKVTDLLKTVKLLIEKKKIQIITNKLMPSKINDIWVDNNIDFNIISTVYENYFMLLTSDKTIHALAKVQNLKSLYIRKGTENIDLEECIFQTDIYSSNDNLSEHQDLVSNYIKVLNKSNIRYPEVIQDIKQLPFIKKIYEDYIFLSENNINVIVLHRIVNDIYKRRYHRYPNNIIKDNDIIVIREGFENSHKYRQIIYFTESINEQKFIRLSDSFVPNVVIDDMIFAQSLVGSLNNVVLVG